jgi:hypothetical protein
VNGSIASGSAVTVNNSGSTLGGTGTINGSVNIASSGALLEAGMGSTGQTLTMKGAVTMGSGSIIQLALGSSATSHSTLAIGTGGSITFQGSQSFAFIDAGAVAGTTYTGIITGVTSNPGTGSWSVNQTYDPGWSGTFTWNSSTSAIDFQLSAVPEPSTYAAAALAFAALLITQRRRLAKLLKHA